MAWSRSWPVPRVDVAVPPTKMPASVMLMFDTGAGIRKSHVTVGLFEPVAAVEPPALTTARATSLINVVSACTAGFDPLIGVVVFVTVPMPTAPHIGARNVGENGLPMLAFWSSTPDHTSAATSTVRPLTQRML